MSKKEFIKNASNLGYCTKKQASEYCTRHVKDEYTEDDYISVCRHSNDQYYRERDYSLYPFGSGRSTKRYYRHGGNESDRE